MGDRLPCRQLIVPTSQPNMAVRSSRSDLAAVTEGDTLTLYLASGKRKHPRFFWVTVPQAAGAPPELSWDKSKAKRYTKNSKPNKTEMVLGVSDRAEIKSAREWFEFVDADKSGMLDRDELAKLYKTARGEKLPRKRLDEAMATMDLDSSGLIDFDEFSVWWKDNGGDLEAQQDLALTIFLAGDLQLLCVCDDAETKDKWVSGLQAALRGEGRSAVGPAAWRRVRELYEPEYWKGVEHRDKLRTVAGDRQGSAQASPPRGLAALASRSTLR